MFPLYDDVPRRSVPFVTWGLIVVNLAFFVAELSLPARDLEELVYTFGIVPARYSVPGWAPRAGLDRSWWPFVTSMFLHGGWFHLISNMWTLWIFGDNVEDRMGAWRFSLFYLLCGVASGVVHYLFNAGSTVPALGASGAIAGVLGAYLVLYPTARVITLVPILFYPLFFELPALLYLGLWFMTQLLSGAATLAAAHHGGGIAWWAHVGGFVAGIVALRLFLKAGVPPNRPAAMHGV